MLRVGIDMIEVGRVTQTMQRYGDRFFARFFTEAERNQCRDIPTRLAARIAAKEATAKALGTGIGEVRWIDIEVRSDERGRPLLLLHNEAARLAQDLGLDEWQVSLSHTHDHAIAFVVAMSR